MRLFQSYQDYPSHEHWQNLQAFKSHLITPQEFENRWDVSRQEIATICDCSLRTVKRWFQESETGSYVAPTVHHLLALTLTNEIWNQTSQQQRLRRLAS